MFYQGDLQSGIALAVRETKSVVCFVRDDQAESIEWENEYFDSALSQLLSDNSVTLRLTAGTQEAGFLTSICPIQSFPAVLVIRNGVVQEYIVAGTSKEEFQTRLRTAIVNSNNNIPPALPVQQTTATTSQESAIANDTETSSDRYPRTPVTPLTPQSQNSSPAEPASQSRQVINDATEQRATETTRNTISQPTAKTPEEIKRERDERDRRALQLKLQRAKREQKEERERIRNQIKQDQEARKQRAAEEKSQSTAAATKPQDTTATANPTATTRKPVSEYRLQIRLFDGSSVRTTFPLSATIRKDVRPWLDSQRSDGSQPYNLKHILTPLPNHTISVSEEERTLEDLGLGPTASLVMVPIPSYIEAYTSPTLADSLLVRAVSSVYGLVSGVVGGAVGIAGSFLGYGATAAKPAETSSSSTNEQQRAQNTTARATPSRSTGAINIRTLRDQREEQDRNEFYNGNTLNFEPNRNDDHKND